MRPAGLVTLIASLFLSLQFPASRVSADPPANRALPLDFPARASALEEAADPDSLVQAVLLRRALGEADRADVDTERFLGRIAAAPSPGTQAAATYLTEVLAPAAWPDPIRWEAAIRRFLAHLPVSAHSLALQSVRIQTEVLLAAHLWESSCSLDPQKRSDAACMQRIDATAEYRASRLRRTEAALRSGKMPASVPELCEPPVYRYIVHSRHVAAAREAQTLLGTVLRRTPALSRALPSDAALKDAIAHAQFLVAEPRFESALAARLSLNLFAEARKPSQLRAGRARLHAWLRARTNIRPDGTFREAAVRESRLYQAIIARGVPAWSVAAYARIAQLSLNIVDQWLRGFPPSFSASTPPAPAGISQEEWAQLFHDASCSHEEDYIFERQIREALYSCNDEAIRGMLDTTYSRTCSELLRHLRYGNPNEALEIFAGPIWSSSLALVRCGLELSQR